MRFGIVFSLLMLLAVSIGTSAETSSADDSAAIRILVTFSDPGLSSANRVGQTIDGIAQVFQAFHLTTAHHAALCVIQNSGSLIAKQRIVD